MLGYFTGCPAGGVLKTGGTPLEVAALLEAYAKLINAFNGSDGGKKILDEVAKQIGSMGGGIFIQQSMQLSQDPGAQVALLAQMGNQLESETINTMVTDTLKDSGKLKAGMEKVIAILRAKYNSATGAEQEVALAHLKNAMNISAAAPTAVSNALLAPFKNENGQLITPEGKPITAKYITQAVMDVASENTRDLDPAKGSRE